MREVMTESARAAAEAVSAAAVKTAAGVRRAAELGVEVGEAAVKGFWDRVLPDPEWEEKMEQAAREAAARGYSGVRPRPAGALGCGPQRALTRRFAPRTRSSGKSWATRCTRSAASARRSSSAFPRAAQRSCVSLHASRVRAGSYERAIECDPGKASYLTNAAAALASLGKRRDACDRCLAAAALDPRFERARSRLATLASTTAGFEDALAAAIKAAADRPSRCGCAIWLSARVVARGCLTRAGRLRAATRWPPSWSRHARPRGAVRCQSLRHVLTVSPRLCARAADAGGARPRRGRRAVQARQVRRSRRRLWRWAGKAAAGQPGL